MYSIVQQDDPHVMQQQQSGVPHLHQQPDGAPYWASQQQYQPPGQYHHKVRMMELRISHYRKWIQNMQKVQEEVSPELSLMTKQIYLGNLPPGCTYQGLRQFISTAMAMANATIVPGNCINYCKILPEQTYAWVTFRSVEEASNALLLDGLMYQGHRLTLRRPNTYDVRKAILMGPTMPDPNVDTSPLDIQLRSDDPQAKYDPTKTMQVRNLPLDWNYFQVKTFFAELADLTQFRLVTDKLTRASRGIAYCQFASEDSARAAVAKLHGQALGRSSLSAVLQADVARDGPPAGRGGGHQRGGQRHRGGRGRRRGADVAPDRGNAERHPPKGAVAPVHPRAYPQDAQYVGQEV